MAMDPREIPVGPLDIYLAAAVEAEDLVDDGDPAGNWHKLGTSGTENYTEDGITITHSQRIRETRAVGATGPLKAIREEESLTIALTLMDLTLGELTYLLNKTAATSVSNGNTYDWLGMRRGPDVTVLSLIAKGESMSPEGAYDMQLYVPRVYQSGDMSPVFSKGENAGWSATYSALEYQSAATAEQRFGRWSVQDG